MFDMALLFLIAMLTFRVGLFSDSYPDAVQFKDLP